MSIEFSLPDLGENIESGDVVNILVQVGDQLVEDQPIIELETDKGHDSFLLDVPALDRVVEGFLK